MFLRVEISYRRSIDLLRSDSVSRLCSCYSPASPLVHRSNRKQIDIGVQHTQSFLDTPCMYGVWAKKCAYIGTDLNRGNVYILILPPRHDHPQLSDSHPRLKPSLRGIQTFYLHKNSCLNGCGPRLSASFSHTL